jgi:predicted small secreted protein
MKEQGSILAVVALVAMAVSLATCNHMQGMKSGQAVPGGATRPAAQNPQPSASANRASAIPSSAQSSASRPVPSAAPKSDASPPKVVVSDRSQTLVVAQQTFRLLTHVQSIEGTSDETVEWWELRDAKEHVVYRESYQVTFENGTFENTVWIGANSFTTPQGSGILIHGVDLPSAPDSGGWVQVFGFRYGRDKYAADESLFGRFGPPILINGEFLDIGTNSFRSTPTSFRGATTAVMNDVLRFRVWTGNFNILYPVLINWITGKLQPAWHCIETTSKGQVERCSYPITVEAHRDNQPTFVRLFPEADDGYTPKHVMVQPQSKIEYLEARTPVAWNEDAKAVAFGVSGDVWIRVRIDGLEGWIHTEEDFEAVGLPQAG